MIHFLSTGIMDITKYIMIDDSGGYDAWNFVAEIGVM
jgi:hypothetical protein